MSPFFLLFLTPSYNVMLACWHEEPDSRPAFEDLAKYLDKMSTTISGEKITAMKKGPSKGLQSCLKLHVDSGAAVVDDEEGYCEPQGAKQQYITRASLPDISEQKIYTDTVWGTVTMISLIPSA
jgi:hypothetical protein